MVSGTRSASSRRTLFAVSLAALLCAASGIKAQPMQDPAPAQAKPEPPDALKLSGDHFILLYSVKPDKTADFESAWATIKEKLAKSEKADVKELAETIKILKVNAVASAGAPPPTSVVYLFDLNPPSKTMSYDPVKIIFSSGAFPDRPEADAVFKKLSESIIGGINLWPLTKVGG
jgi:hypothetical protein